MEARTGNTATLEPGFEPTREPALEPTLDEPGEATRTALLRQAGQPAELVAESKLPIERIAGLPVQLDVCVPLRNFRVSDLLSLAPGSVVASDWLPSDDVPLACGDVPLLWTEFEVVDQTLAVRVTRLL